MIKHLFSFFLFSTLALTGCQKGSTPEQENALRIWMSQNGKVKVLSTTAMISDLVEQIGGEHIDSYTLIQADSDPHSYQLVKGDDEKLKRADLIFYNGLNLEHGPSLKHYLDKSTKAYALGNFLLKNEKNAIIAIDSTYDPHVWMDISLWSETIPYIVDTLSEAIPEHSGEFEKKGDALASDLGHLHKAIRKMLKDIPSEKRYLVTTHDAFNYFARAYLAEDSEVAAKNFSARFQAPEGLAPDSQLSTVDVHRLLEHITRYKIKVLFPEASLNRDSLKKLVDAGEQKGLKLRIWDRPLYADSMGTVQSGADSYLRMIYYDAQVIQEGLQGDTR